MSQKRPLKCNRPWALIPMNTVYTLAQLTRFYEEFSGGDGSHPKFRSIDLKGRL